MADASARDHAPSKTPMSARRAMGLRQLAASLDERDDTATTPLSGYACGHCAEPLPIGVLDCPACRTPVAETEPVAHTAVVDVRDTEPIVLDDPQPAESPQAAMERTRLIRRNWLRRPDQGLD